MKLLPISHGSNSKDSSLCLTPSAPQPNYSPDTGRDATVALYVLEHSLHTKCAGDWKQGPLGRQNTGSDSSTYQGAVMKWLLSGLLSLFVSLLPRSSSPWCCATLPRRARAGLQYTPHSPSVAWEEVKANRPLLQLRVTVRVIRKRESATVNPTTRQSGAMTNNGTDPQRKQTHNTETWLSLWRKVI
jgi:hypothetical protein